MAHPAAIKGERGTTRMLLRGNVALLTVRRPHLFVSEGAKVVLTDIRDELGERAADYLLTRVTDRPRSEGSR